MSGIGHIGELQAISEFESVGYAIYLPMKDKGIDFIAVKNNRSTQIQVKTSKFQKESYFWFDLHKSKMIYHENTYYVFVLYVLPRRKMMGKAKNYLVIPSLDLQSMIESGSIVSKQGNENILNIFIYPDESEKTWKYKNKGQEVNLTKYWNSFGCMHGS
ncbi:hypothetical protein [Litorivivens sp.]|uniref:hypothetical protein n=1 Tax=Litorivivens sp. TaxID=2020868 RepID=UPI0035699B07